VGSPREPADHVDYRYSFANERTFLAWVRTALALLAGGIGVVNLPSHFAGSTTRSVLGIALMALGVTAAVVGVLRWRAAEAAMHAGDPLRRSAEIPVLAGALIAVATLALIAVCVTVA
jgi:putative membrane protein